VERRDGITDPDGYYNIAAYHAGAYYRSHALTDVQPGVLVESGEELSQRWREFHFAGMPPAVDFSTHVVVVYVAYERDGGCGVRPIIGLRVLQPAGLAPEPQEDLCVITGPLLLGTHIDVLRVVRALALARSVLSSNDFVLVGPPATRVHVRSKPQSPVARSELQQLPAPRQRVGHAVLPEPGTTVAGQLDDGSRVWIVRHADRSASVIAGDFPFPDADVGTYSRLTRAAVSIEGFRLPTSWFGGERSFNSLFDEFGVAIYAVMPNLDRYEVAPDALDREGIIVGARVPGIVGHTLRAPLAPSISGPPGGAPAYAPEEWPAMGLDTASSEGPGAVVSVCAGLVGQRDGSVRLCAERTSDDGKRSPVSACSASLESDESTSPCERLGPRVLDASTHIHTWGKAVGSDATLHDPFVAGPLLLRVSSAGGFTDAILLSSTFP
jgi:hypothetical protein